METSPVTGRMEEEEEPGERGNVKVGRGHPGERGTRGARTGAEMYKNACAWPNLAWKRGTRRKAEAEWTERRAPTFPK